MSRERQDATTRIPGPIESHSIDWIPESERYDRVALQAPFWFLSNFQFLTISLGFVGPSLGLNLLWSSVAGILGVGIGSWFAAFHGAQGPSLGLPQMIQSRAQLGYRGVVVATAIAFLIFFATAVIGQVVLADGLHSGFGWSRALVQLGASAVVLTLAVYGHHWLHRAFRCILAVTFPLIALVTIGILTGRAGGHAPAAHLGFDSTAFFAQLAVAASYNLIFAPYVSDYTRYLPVDTRHRTVVLSVFVGTAASPAWLIPLGAWMAIHLGVGDGLIGLKLAGNASLAGVGTAAALASAVSLAIIGAINAYGASLSLLTSVDCFRKVRATRAVRVVTITACVCLWTAVGLLVTGSASHTVSVLLTLMLYLIVPWSAVNLVDFYWVRRRRYAIAELFDPNGVYGQWNWRGLTAYAVGFACEVPFMSLPDVGSLGFTGPVARALSGIDVAWVVGLCAAGGVYLALAQSLSLRRERALPSGARTAKDIEPIEHGPATTTIERSGP